MNTIIEIHDSEVARVDVRDGDVIVHFVPAYLHKSEGRPGFDPGAGWVQDACLVFSNASVRGDLPELPCVVMDGALTIGGELHDSCIPVPLVSVASAELRLVFDPVHSVTVTGQGVQLQLLGEPKFVEDY